MTRPSWTTVAPVLAIVALVPAWFAHPGSSLVLGLLALLLVGAVLAAVKQGGRLYLNCGEDFRTDFTATAKPAAARRWRKGGLIDLETLTGAAVRVRGYVASINGPSIEIAHALQVERLSGLSRSAVD